MLFYYKITKLFKKISEFNFLEDILAEGNKVGQYFNENNVIVN